MRKKRSHLIIVITIAMIIAGISVAFAYGKMNAEKTAGGDSRTYFDTLNDYDWSKTCPGASCRDGNE